MQIYGQVIKTQPGYGVISDYPYRGCLYNEYGQLISTDAGGMTEEACKSALTILAQKVYDHDFKKMPGFFPIEKEKTGD